MKKATILVPLASVILIWTVLVTADWYYRFNWFGWHQQFMTTPSATSDSTESTGAASFGSIDYPARKGGDLSGLLPSRKLKARFEQARDAETVTFDPEGYINLPYDRHTRFDVAVAGDSYMVSGGAASNHVSGVLAQQLGRPVLNRALAGRGPFHSLVRYIGMMERGASKPQTIIWGFAEREIHGSSFASYAAQLGYAPRGSGLVRSQDSKPKPAAGLKALAPANLQATLPDSSAMAQFGRRFKDNFFYQLFGQLPREVFIMESPAGQESMLGYRPALDMLLMPEEDRKMDEAADAVLFVRDFLQKMEIRLLVVPVPDKESIYNAWIPATEINGSNHGANFILPEFITALAAKGVQVVDLWGPFNAARDDGIALYWRDDTHWSRDAIRLAAEAIVGHFDQKNTQTR